MGQLTQGKQIPDPLGLVGDPAGTAELRAQAHAYKARPARRQGRLKIRFLLEHDLFQAFPVIQPGREQEVFEKLSKTQPIGRMAKPDEVATLALYLCSDEASFITGTDYFIDGGFERLNT